MHTSIQQEIARAERLRRSHKRTHKCKSKTCEIAQRYKQIVREGEKLMELSEVHHVPKGSIPDVRRRIIEALSVDEHARADALIFAMLVYEILEPGEVLMLEAFDRVDTVGASKWATDMLKEAGATFEFDSAVFSEFPI